MSAARVSDALDRMESAPSLSHRLIMSGAVLAEIEAILERRTTPRDDADLREWSLRTLYPGRPICH